MWLSTKKAYSIFESESLTLRNYKCMRSLCRNWKRNLFHGSPETILSLLRRGLILLLKRARISAFFLLLKQVKKKNKTRLSFMLDQAT